MALRPHTVQTLLVKEPVGALALAIERRELFTAGETSQIHVWSLDDGRMTRSFEAHAGSMTSLTWLSHVRLLASTSLDHSMAVWSPKGDKMAKAKFPCAVYAGCYSTKCDLFVVGGKHKMFAMKLSQSAIAEWTLKVVATFEEHQDFVSQIVCTPVGRMFSCGFDGFICAFELNVEDKLVLMTVSGERAKARCHKSAITCASFNSEANQLITGGLWVCVQGSLIPHVFDTRTGTDLSVFLPPVNLKEMLLEDFPVKIVASQDTKELVTVSNHQVMVTWRFDPLSCISVIRGHTDWVELLLRTPGINPEIISAGADSTVRRWHSPTPLYPQLYSFKDTMYGHQGSVCCGTVNEEGTMVFTGGDDSVIRGWSLDDSVNEATTDVGEVCKFVMEGHDGRVTGMCTLYHYIISVANDQCVRIWDGNTGTLWKVIEDAHMAAINDVAANPENGTFATCGSDGKGFIWAYDPCEMLGSMIGHSAEVSKVRWCGAHSAWVTASDDNTLRMWQGEDGLPLMKDAALRAQGYDMPEFEGEPIIMKLNTERFSAMEVLEADGWVVVGLSDSSVVVLDLTREVVLQVYQGHNDQVRSMVVIPEKNQILTAGWDHSIRVWSLRARSRKDTAGKAAPPTKGASLVNLANAVPTEEEQANRPFAEKVPPLDPMSLKFETTLFKSWDREEVTDAMTREQNRETQKEKGHMSWILRCIEEGNEDALASSKKAWKKPHRRPGDGTAAAAAPAGARAAGRGADPKAVSGKGPKHAPGGKEKDGKEMHVPVKREASATGMLSGL